MTTAQHPAGSAPIFVLTNDDGIDAPGLQAMKTALLAVNPQARAVIVAPLADASGTGHRVTTRGPLALHPRGVQFRPHIGNEHYILGSDLQRRGDVLVARGLPLRPVARIEVRMNVTSQISLH